MEADELGSEELWSLAYRAVLPRDHPQASRKSVRLEGLSGETLITYPRKLIGESYDQLIAFCHARGSSRKPSRKSPTLPRCWDSSRAD